MVTGMNLLIPLAAMADAASAPTIATVVLTPSERSARIESSPPSTPMRSTNAHMAPRPQHQISIAATVGRLMGVGTPFAEGPVLAEAFA